MIEEELISLMTALGLTLSTAESLTGGLISARLVSVPGASLVFKEGFVTYDSQAKVRTLGVEKNVIETLGAVSESTARMMAEGAAGRAGTDCAVSATGVAGPDPAEGKPVGLVYVGAYAEGETFAKELHLTGSRQEIREAAARSAIELLLRVLGERV